MKKTHYRRIIRNRYGDGRDSFTVACGCRATILTKDTTKDKSKVTCKRCLKKIKLIENEANNRITGDFA